MTDLQGLSSNILLIGFVLVGIACLYLLYSNYKKTQELEDLNTQVNVLKDIFTKSQKDYLELRDHVVSSLQINNLIESRPINNQQSNTTDVKDMNESIKTIRVEQQDLVSTILNSNIEKLNDNTENTTNKTIEIIDDDLKDLKDLDNLDEPDELNNDDDLIEEDNDENVLDLGNVDEHMNSIKNDNELNIEDIIDDMIDDDISDTKSIKTDPNNNDLNDLDIDIDLDELENTMNETDSKHQDVDLNQDLDSDTTKIIKVEEDLDLLSSILKNQDELVTDENSKNISLDLELDLNNTLNVEVKKNDDTKSISLDQLLNSKGDESVDLHSMSVKQLKELAKQKKIKTVGTKQELIQALQNA